MILTSGCGVGGKELGERSSLAQIADTGHDQAPDDGTSAAGGESECN